MPKFTPGSWLFFAVALASIVLVAFGVFPYRDPLIGPGLRFCIASVGFQVCVAGATAFVLVRYHWRVLAYLAIVCSLVFAVPAPSKGSVKLQVVNATSSPAEVAVSRVDNPARRVVLFVSPSQTVSYRSAPGDYSEGIRFVIEHGTQRQTTSVAELRSHRIRLSESGILLVEVQKN